MEIENQTETNSMMNIDLDLDAEQFLSFYLAGEEYGVDILRVQEIKCWDNATEIPNSPDYLKGVINLRGTIVPVIDMRQRFGIEAIDYTETTVVIVLKVEDNDRERTVGFIVDAVSEVYTIENDLVNAPPETGDSIDLGFVKGLTSINEKMVVLLDIDHLIDDGKATGNQNIH